MRVKEKDRLVQNYLAWGLNTLEIATKLGASSKTIRRSKARIRQAGEIVHYTDIVSTKQTCPESGQSVHKVDTFIDGTLFALSDSSPKSSPVPKPSETSLKSRFNVTLAEEVPPPDPIPYEAIIGYLNEETGRAFEWKGERGAKNRELIRNLWKRGFRGPDFSKVIEKKCRDWNHKPKQGQQDMRPYLRPQTLFQASKFESYLNG